MSLTNQEMLFELEKMIIVLDNMIHGKNEYGDNIRRNFIREGMNSFYVESHAEDFTEEEEEYRSFEELREMIMDKIMNIAENQLIEEKRGFEEYCEEVERQEQN